MLRILKMIGVTIISIIGLLVLVGVLFVNFSPQFGGTIGDQQKAQFGSLANFKDGKFSNDKPNAMSTDYVGMLRKQFQKDPSRSPSKTIEVTELDSLDVVERAAEPTFLTWFGHSTFLLEMDGKKILLDPMLSDVPAPHPFLGPSRFSKRLPIPIDKIPNIDAVLISHDHYDHLDYPSIKKLKSKVDRFYVPLGVGAHLESWGVEPSKITELYWWQEAELDSIKLISTPARHFSGRGLSDRDATLWCSWVIQGSTDNIYFSGDSGYDGHFKEIGDKYGPFDISLMECGQYNEDWKNIHMMPEETVKGAVDLRSEVFMPIHWAGFTLAFHSWTDPVERSSKKALELDIPIVTPEIGETFQVGEGNYPSTKWWTKYQ